MKVIAALILVAALSLGAQARADSADGADAFHRGDYETALQEWRPLAEQGDADTQISLSGMYRLGLGVPVDDKRSHMWANISAVNESKIGAKYRDKIARRMTLEDISQAEEMAWQCVNSNYTYC